MNIVKKIIHKFFKKISRLVYLISRTIFLITPQELKKTSRIEEILNDSSSRKNFQTFEKYLTKSVLCKNVEDIRKYSIENALSNETEKVEDYFYLEFGVWKGESANFFSKYVKNFYAFDSFEGLSEDWAGASPKGTFNLKKKLPNLNSNVKTVIGLVENTLDDFLKKNNPKINFVHMDMDTYTPTKYTLEKLKPYLIKNAVIIFDELYNYIGWEHGEYKALKDTFKDDEYEYKAFNLRGAQVVVQIK